MGYACSSRFGYFVREYPSWYNVIYKGDEGCQYQHPPEEVMLWIRRPCGSVVETPDTMTTEVMMDEFSADAILGVIDINGSLYLNLVVSSERVADVSFDQATASDCDTSSIFSVRATRMVPLDVPPSSSIPPRQYDVVYPESSDDGRSATSNRSGSKVSQGNDLGIASTGSNANIINDLNQLLTTGHYFSRSADLTRSLQRQWQHGLVPLHPKRFTEQWTAPVDSTLHAGDSSESKARGEQTLFDIADPMFNWVRCLNHNIPSHWITVLIQGYVGYSSVHWNDKLVELLLIGRRSTYRYGTRLNARGIDKDGNVGNFVETELRLRVDNGPWKSHVQVRGSVPVFWGQKSIFSPAYFTRPLSESEDAFLLHYSQLESMYGVGSEICMMSLLDTKASEIALNQAMDHIFQTFVDMQLHMVRYNYNEMVKWTTMVNELMTFVNLQLLGTMQRIGYFDGALLSTPVDLTERRRLADGRIEGTQLGVIRTNCLDCLDRTNAMQLMIGWVWMAGMLDPDGLTSLLDSDYDSDFSGSLHQFRDMWCALGDQISLQHAGTVSIYSQHIREGKQSYSAMLYYAKTMANRAYNHVFNDDARQACFDILMNAQESAYASTSECANNSSFVDGNAGVSLYNITIWCGTWNMHGNALSDRDDMYDWMSTGVQHGADVYVFCMQEFVELSMLNILTSKTEENKEVLFNGKVLRMLSALHEDRNARFFHLGSCSMIGLYLSVFVNDNLRYSIRNVITTAVKTGLNYSTGNKGAVGLKFEIAGHNVTFIDVHLNSGKQTPNNRVRELEYVMENAFAETVPSSLQHEDLLVLAGDFNFQIAAEEKEFLDIFGELYRGNLRKLLRRDEFLNAVKNGLPRMSNLQEGPISFEPTYKFKPETDNYDLKRPPAWCDRVLYGGRSATDEGGGIKCLSYNRHNGMVSSDHKAVSAVLRLSTVQRKKEEVSTLLIDI